MLSVAFSETVVAKLTDCECIVSSWHVFLAVVEFILNLDFCKRLCMKVIATNICEGFGVIFQVPRSWEW